MKNIKIYFSDHVFGMSMYSRSMVAHLRGHSLVTDKEINYKCNTNIIFLQVATYV